MNFIKKFIARIFRIRTYVISDTELSKDELKKISDFLYTPVGKKFSQHLLAQRMAIADKVSEFQWNGDYWKGYANGYKAAINNILTFRQPDENGITSKDSGGVGLEDFADIYDQTER